ncbi:hypothetical protein [Paracraurococcus lichenis]|uniref:Uncharacterized protein n=1 Tax=Paracraurococcus lichenis TaxID=3064888 RepID=A0ABT9E6F1_9PROT|nr:hypothetical protein [Paracraurococcus sp. LOR1-02]MDO9711746.1 hypothetical protein [Paracraurococcus sp. LOR1-02]
MGETSETRLTSDRSETRRPGDAAAQVVPVPAPADEASWSAQVLRYLRTHPALPVAASSGRPA